MADIDRGALLRRYREGPAVLAAALAGLSPGDLDHQPSDGGWSPRMVAHHTADSELTSAIRLRRLIAEDQPVVGGYDEELFARRLHYTERPIETSLLAVRAVRESTASILDLLTEEEWSRSGTHSDSGPYSVERWLEIYAAHCHDHAEQVLRAVAERCQG